MTRLVLLLGVCFVVLISTSCSGSLFKVKPVAELPPLPAHTRSAGADGVPVRVELAFQNGAAIELNKARFHLRDDQNHEWKLLSPKRAVSRIMKANGVTLYNPNSRKQFEQEFGAYAIDLKAPLSSDSPRRQGFLFFQPPDKKAVTTAQKLTLTVERLPQTVSVAVN